MPPARDPAQPPVRLPGKLWRIAFVVVLGLLAWTTVVTTLAPNVPEWRSVWLFLADPVLGVIAGVLTIWRRRRPLLIAFVVTLLGVISTSAGGAVLLVLASVAARRRWRELAWLAPLNVASGVAVERLYPSDPTTSTPLLVMLILIVLLVAAAALAPFIAPFDPAKQSWALVRKGAEQAATDDRAATDVHRLVEIIAAAVDNAGDVQDVRGTQGLEAAAVAG